MDQRYFVAHAPVKIMVKKKIVSAIIGIVIVLWGALSILVEIETTPKKETLYSNGQKRALIIFHPSWKYQFQDKLTEAFAHGLNSSGWAVDRITTSGKHLTDFNNYDLYVIGANTYYWRPDLPIKRFLSDLDLKKKPVIGLVSGPGYTERSEKILKDLIAKTNASPIIIHSFSIWRTKVESLVPETNWEYAISSAYDRGKEIGAGNLK